MGLVDFAIRRRRGWALALVPALLLRAFIPAGFMPAVGEGSLALVFCEPGVLASASPHTGHHGHDGAGHGGHSASGECPFAQSAAPALPTLAAVPPSPPLVAEVGAAWRDDAAPGSAPRRYAAPRGPPSLC
jgi:hypothetical protein